MNFKEMSLEDKQQYAELMFQRLSSAEELKNWVMLFLGLDMPIGQVDPDSNSSPIDAMWEIYDNIRSNRGDEIPGYIMLSAREAYKTLGASILETILTLHFEITIAHMSAIQAQSAKAIQYINYFFNKIEPLLEVSGWIKTSENKSKISFRTKNGEDAYIKVIVATMAGANSEHTSLMFVDEVDVIASPQAYEEAKLIPGYTKGIFPVTVKLSTRKFAFGLMQKELDMAPISGDKILRWNTLDVTERCPETRHKPELPKENVYTAKALPLRIFSVEEYESLSDPEKPKWELQSQVHAGCVKCKLLPVCKTRLSQRPLSATKGLYKPIQSVLNSFKKVSPDMAEAQLLCWKPSSKGLVYPRFEGTVNEGNVITLNRAWETLMGEPSKKKSVSEADLIWKMQNLGIRFFAGVDWGYTHDFVIVIFALIPNGEIWIVDCYSAPGLEFSDCLEVAKSYRDKYRVERWFCDTAMPSHLKSFTKNGMKSPSFAKDVMGGIESLRSKIVDGSGRRLLKVIYTDNNQKIIRSFQKHHFKLGSDGNPTLYPDDTPGTSDQADAMRYVGQNLFPIKGPQKPEFVVTDMEGKPIDGSTPEGKAEIEKKMTHNQQMKDELGRLVQDSAFSGGTGKKGGFFWST